MAKILLAEDDLSTRRFLAAALEKAGHNIISCADGLEALTALQSNDNFDLLLTDIVMPGMDGIELSNRAGALYPDMKIMFITGFAAMALNRNSDAQNPAKIVSKPFHLGNLIAQIDELLKTK